MSAARWVGNGRLLVRRVGVLSGGRALDFWVRQLNPAAVLSPPRHRRVYSWRVRALTGAVEVV